MYVLAFVNPKGGSGKTTAALLLAEQIAKAGAKTVILDLDPNANMRREAGQNVPFTIHARPSVDDTLAEIEALRNEYEYLIIDLEGSKDQIVTFALSRTDLCIIPLDGSPMEARQAAQAVKLVKTTANMTRQDINYALLFTRTNAAFLSVDERDVREEMEDNGISVLPTRLAKRAPYTRIFREGLLLDEIYENVRQDHNAKTRSLQEKAEKQITSAIENAQDYAQAVMSELTKGHFQ